MLSFIERFKAQMIFNLWAEKYRATKEPLSVIAWLLPVIDEDKFREFIKDQEKLLSLKEGVKNEKTKKEH